MHPYRTWYLLVAVCVALALGAAADPATAQAQDSCTGPNACTGNTGKVGKGSCNGENACEENTGDIAKDACNGWTACTENSGNIGKGSCNGDFVCWDNTGDIAKGSCNGDSACLINTGKVAQDACNGFLSCNDNEGTVAKESCNGDSACLINTGNVGKDSCNGSSGAAKRGVLPSVEHRQHRYLNNRAENSHQPTRQRERRMQGFKSPGHAQRFLATYGPIAQHFRPRRHRVSAADYRQAMRQRFETWQDITRLPTAA
jgi:hypothetical protein